MTTKPPEPSSATDAQLWQLFQRSRRAMCILAADSGRVLAANPAMLRHYGYGEAKFLTMQVWDLWPQPPDGDMAQIRNRAPQPGQAAVTCRHHHRDGTLIEVEITADALQFQGVAAHHWLVLDITQRAHAEREWARLHRAHQMLSSCNMALIRATLEDSLLREICRITVDIGGYWGAWVGFTCTDEAKTIERVAFAGVTPAYPPQYRPSWSDAVPEGMGAAGHTVRSGKTTILHDVADTAGLRPWGHLLQAAGVRGVVCLPLRDGTRTFGVLLLYAHETIDASHDEIQLLEELANDLAFGIGSLRAQQESRRDVQTRAEILDIQQQIAGLGHDLPRAMQTITRRACGLTTADGSSIDLLDGELLHTAAHHGRAPSSQWSLNGNSLAALAARTGTTQSSTDTETDPRVDREATRSMNVRSLVILPLLVQGAVAGVFKIAWRQPQAFTPRDVANLQILVGTLGATLQRHRLSEQLRTSENQYRMLFDSNPQPMWVVGQDMHLLAVNQAMVENYGYSRQELLSMHLSELWANDVERGQGLVREHLREQSRLRLLHQHRTKNGKTIDVEIITNSIIFNGAPARLVMGTDITQRLRAERELAQVSRAQQMLSTCNEALIRASSEAALLADICRITVDIGGYLGAWVGFALDDAAKSLERVAYAGTVSPNTEVSQISWAADDPRGKGPAGRTIRSGQAVIISDHGDIDPALAPSHSTILASGIRGLVCLPLRDLQRTFGVLVLCTKEALHVSQEELQLLQELANDLAFGIGNLRAQTEQRRLQNAVLTVAAAVSASSGLEFFVEMARHMCEALGAQAAFVTRLLPGEPPRGRTLAAVLNGQRLDDFDYAILGTPCENLFRNNHWAETHDVTIRFPQAQELAQMGAQAYVGQRLEDAHGQPIGQVFVLYCAPLVDYAFIQSTLQIFAARVAAEMQRLKADAQLRDQAALLDKAQDAIVQYDLAGNVIFWNHGAERLTGWTAEEAMGQPMYKRIFVDHTAFAQGMHQLMQTGTWQGEVQHLRKDGRMVAVESHRTLVHDELGQPRSVLSINTDITQRKAAEREIQQLAFYDQLTQLPNRLLLMDRLQQALTGSARHGRYGALLFIDLDNFKTLNDTLGHESGDLLLQQVATRLSGCVRGVDTVSRFGGDEFVVMLEDLSDNSAEAALIARSMGEKMLAALAVPYVLGGVEHNTTSSIGVAPFGQESLGTGELLKQADLAMYQAKTAGRNAIRFFNPSMQAIVNARAQLELEMRQALAQQEYLLHYQPQFNAEGQIIGVEALLRWLHPQRGLISPAEFIPVAEDTGIIIPLGQWVLRSACQHLKRWHGQAHTAHISMAVNVSARQFHHPDFVEQTIQTVLASGVDARLLKLELTESLLVNDLDLTIAKMTALQALGLGFSLDDFGTGYSSLSYLKRLPLGQLKIDQSFVRDIAEDVNDASIVRTIIALGQSLGLAVIAEGVETTAQRDFLALHGCAAYQGYLFSRPLPIDSLDKLLASSAD
ncbi:MAG: EAL domain-containing protein [Burkholderiales bacterium]|nr:EAL domain-containing protein [Burkholderiales bacterium]